MLTDAQIKTWKEEGAVICQLPSEIINPIIEWLNTNLTLDHIDKNHLDFGTPDRKFEFPTFIKPFSSYSTLTKNSLEAISLVAIVLMIFSSFAL